MGTTTPMDKKLPVNTIVKSPLSISIPVTDVPSYVFSSGTPESRGIPQYYDAESPSQNFSLEQAEIRVKQLARGLQKLGLQPGDRVLLFSSNRLLFPIVLWGVAAAGCVFTAIAPSASPLELEYQWKDSGARILLVSRDGADVALKAAKSMSKSNADIFVFGDDGEDLSHPQIRPWTDIFCSPEEAQSWSWKRITTLEEAKNTTVIINYSSGTTGLPKGVEITHYNLIANTEQLLCKRSGYANNERGQERKRNIDNSGERWLAPLPMYHAYGQTYYCMSAVRLGAKVFIMSKFTLEKYLQFLDIYRITFITSVPTILTMLDKIPHPKRYNLKSAEVLTTGSAPLNGELAASITRKYLRSGVIVKQGWGMTETTSSVTGFAPDDDDDGRSIGWLNPNCAAKIVPIDEDTDREDAQEADIGEIWVAGPNIMKGYWGNEDATKTTLIEQDGMRWLRTGDISYIDTRGCAYIVDRLKELIKVKGLQVSPSELQLSLVSHPGVVDAAVVGAKIRGQEHPRAFVVRKTSDVTSQELYDYIKSRFTSHKWLTGGVYFIESIPRTPSGKVKPRELPKITTDSPAKL